MLLTMNQVMDITYLQTTYPIIYLNSANHNFPLSLLASMLRFISIQPFIYGGDVQFAEVLSMYGTFQDTAENHKYPPPPATCPFPSTQIIPQRLSTGITSTPVLYRMLAMHPPGDKSLISVHQLEACLQKDLDGNVVVTAPHFFLELLWPANTSPLPLNQNIFPILVTNGVWDSIHNCFAMGPESYSEVDMAKWLNALGGMLGVFTTGVKCQ